MQRKYGRHCSRSIATQQTQQMDSPDRLNPCTMKSSDRSVRLPRLSLTIVRRNLPETPSQINITEEQSMRLTKARELRKDYIKMNHRHTVITMTDFLPFLASSSRS